MWRVRAESIPGGQRFEILRADSPVRFQELFHLLETDPEFAAWYTGVLAGAGFAAFFWEHPPVSTRNLDAAAEFVLLDAPSLGRLQADPEPFRAHFERRPDEAVASFPNIGTDAVLVVPRPLVSQAAYAHLAAFVREGPPSQIRALWQRVGSAMRESLGPQPRWLSTAGMGVPWLHVRIDSHPKYYRFAPYRDAAA